MLTDHNCENQLESWVLYSARLHGLTWQPKDWNLMSQYILRRTCMLWDQIRNSPNLVFRKREGKEEQVRVGEIEGYTQL